MRCKACDAANPIAYDPPDYYCRECLEIIFRTTKNNFTVADTYRIVADSGRFELFPDSGRKRGTRDNPFPELWRP